MATHTDGGKGAYGRKFSISRENGQVDKNGRPYFFEWLKELPAEKGKRKFETRAKEGKTTNYELFSALDGYLIDVREEMKDLGKGMEAWLIIQLTDSDDEYLVEVGRVDERYAIDIMKRLLNPNFRPSQKLRLSPYAIKDEKSGRWNIGVSAFSGVDKLEYGQESVFLKGIPRATQTEWKGETLWDFSPVSKWLFEKISELIIPNLTKDPVSVPKKQPSDSASFPKGEIGRDYENATPVEGDDLPF